MFAQFLSSVCAVIVDIFPTGKTVAQGFIEFLVWAYSAAVVDNYRVSNRNVNSVPNHPRPPFNQNYETAPEGLVSVNGRRSQPLGIGGGLFECCLAPNFCKFLLFSCVLGEAKPRPDVDRTKK